MILSKTLIYFHRMLNFFLKYKNFDKRTTATDFCKRAKVLKL